MTSNGHYGCIHGTIGILALCLAAIIPPLWGTTASAEVYVKVGIMKKPMNLNPFGAADAWTKRVLMLIFHPLYLVEPETLNLIPWLAKDQPTYDPERKTLTFQLREMRWSDGNEFTAEDVVFTARVFKRFRIPRYYPYWKFVDAIQVLDNRTVQMTIEEPMAVLFTRTLTTWVVQKRKWEPIVQRAEKKLEEELEKEKAGGREGEEALEAALKEPRKIIQHHVVKEPTGLGGFELKEWEGGNYLLLVKNRHFFGAARTIAGKKLGPYVDGVIFKIYDNVNAAALALKEGAIDFLWKGVSHALMEELSRTPDLRLETSLDSGYRYLGFNLRNSPMSDAAFRRAVAYLIDKDFIVRRILHDHGRRLDSVVPPGTSFYFNENTPTYGKGMDREERTREAYKILTSAGYRWETPPIDDEGRLQKGEGLVMPDGKSFPSLTILAPAADYDAEMASAGHTIHEWLTEFGVPVLWQSMPFGGLVRHIRNGSDFNMYILGWRSLSDPDYLRRFFHSSYISPNGVNYTGYSNDEFDRLADLQAKTMDRDLRRKIVLELQDLLMRDLPYIPLYVPVRLEGIRTDKFEGWTTKLGGVGNHWTFCLLRDLKK